MSHYRVHPKRKTGTFTIKIFRYIDQLGCFVVNPEYKKIADKLGLTEWNEVVWIGRFFSLDNDHGEHWFDNWKERKRIKSKANKIGLEIDDLFIIDPDRLKNGEDGPCHTDNERKIFWTDVLKSLELSLDSIFNEAVKFNKRREKTDDDFIVDLEDRIKEIKNTCITVKRQ